MFESPKVGQKPVEYITENGKKLVITTNEDGDKDIDIFSKDGKKVGELEVDYRIGGPVLKAELAKGSKVILTDDDIGIGLGLNPEGAKYKVEMEGFFQGKFNRGGSDQLAELVIEGVYYAKKAKNSGAKLDMTGTNVERTKVNGQGKNGVVTDVGQTIKESSINRQKSHLQKNDPSKGAQIFEHLGDGVVRGIHHTDEGSNAKAMKILADAGISAAMATQLLASFAGKANVGDLITDELLKGTKLGKYLHDACDKLAEDKGWPLQIAFAAIVESIAISAAHRTIESNYSRKEDGAMNKPNMPKLEAELETPKLKVDRSDILPMDNTKREEMLDKISYKVGDWGDRSKMRQQIKSFMAGATRAQALKFLNKPLDAACACDAYAAACEAIYGYTPTASQIWQAGKSTVKTYNLPNNGKDGQAGPVRFMTMQEFEKIFKPQNNPAPASTPKK